MNRRHYLVLFLIALVVNAAIASFQHLPGYMDADYYFAGGIQLARGKGFTEPYIWNYLDNPQGIPHPSNTYWMPLASIVSALGMLLTGSTTYSAGRITFILLSACVPLLTATLAYKVSGKPLLAFVSGLLSIFSSYAPFVTVTDNYAIFMLLGGAILILIPRREKWIPLVLGLLTGLMTLARMDGLLWIGLIGLAIFWQSAQNEDRSLNPFLKRLQIIVPAGLLVLAGYLIVMGPWHFRNWTLFHSLMAPGGGRLLWVQDYKETFVYPADRLSLESFLHAGWNKAVENRLFSLEYNLFNNTFIVQGEIFLLPLMLIGLWQLRRDLRTKVAVTGWVILFAVMVLAFPLAAYRGSFLHSGAALQLYWWAAAPIGMDVIVSWARARGRFAETAPVFFQGLLVIITVLFTSYLIYLKFFQNGWSRDDYVYASVEKMLLDRGGRPGEVVIVRNPPGYYIASDRPAVALPFGDESTILAVAEKYDAHYLVLEQGGTFDQIKNLYDDPSSNPSFIFLGEVDGAKLYRIEPAQ